MKRQNLVLLIAAASVLGACAALQSGGEPPAQLTAAQGASLRACGVIGARFEYPNTQIDVAEPVMAAAVTLNGIPVAQHCLVRGQMFKRKGVDGQDYAIGFEMRLPLDWNGRFFHQVNGGIDGVVQPAYGPNTHSRGALATAGTTVNHPFAPNVKLPDLGSAFTAQERQTVAKAVLQKCDALDGAADGMVQDVKACQAAFDLSRDVASCSAARTGQCLTAGQKTLVSQVYAGGKTQSGKLIYRSFPWDTGVQTPNWAYWKFVNSQVLDPAAGYIFMSPTRSINALEEGDLDERHRAIHATAAPFTESADAAITPPGKDNPVNLAPLRARGAKMLMYHGVSDAIFSANDTAAWWDRLNQAQGGRGADFARYFPVPGMAHCSGGPATDRFDGLSALVKWVEQGDAPSQLFSSSRGAGNTAGVNTDVPSDWSPTRTRPLCPYPMVARYTGSGDVEDAGNFACR